MKNITDLVKEDFYKNIAKGVNPKNNPTYKKFLKEIGNSLIVNVKGKDYFYYNNSFVAVEEVENTILQLLTDYMLDSDNCKNFEITSIYIGELNRNNVHDSVQVWIEYKIDYKFSDSDTFTSNLQREATVKSIFYDLFKPGDAACIRVAEFLRSGKIIQ